MYFGVSWLDPRLQINETALEWTEVKTGPKDVSLFTITQLCAIKDRLEQTNNFTGAYDNSIFTNIKYVSASKCIAREPKIFVVSGVGDIRPRTLW